MAFRKDKKQRQHNLNIVYVLFQKVPQVLEKYIKKKHNIELLEAIEKTEDDLKKVLTVDEWSHIFHIRSKIANVILKMYTLLNGKNKQFKTAVHFKNKVL